MKLTHQGGSSVPIYTVAGASTARPLPEYLVRQRKRSLKKDGDFAKRVELLQDFEFDEASQCVRVSDDGEWVMSTGTYKPQIHTHYLPHLSLSFARHTNTVNQTFLLLSADYSKSLHLQTDRVLEFHAPGGVHYTTRIPRYGRDLKYNRRNAEALVPAVGVNADGNGEAFRLNLELGRFMKGYEIEVGNEDEALTMQGGIHTGSVNCAAVADDSHGLLAFGTSIGTVEFWDARSRSRVSTLRSPITTHFDARLDASPEISALAFDRSGLNLVTGSSHGIVRSYDLRSPVPLLERHQGYDYPIQSLQYLDAPLAAGKFLSADRKGIKIWDRTSGDYWTGIEPAVELNHVEWVPDSGMILTANEGRQQHAFFIPQLGPAPKWCAFLDNLVDEMAEDAGDPNSYTAASNGAGEVYDNYKFLDMKQLRELSLDHLIGSKEASSLLRPYMHGYFVGQKLFEQARLLVNPDMAEQQRQKSIQQKIDKEREGRIRGVKRAAVKVNRRYAETLAAREEANETRRVQRLLRQGAEIAEAETAEANDLLPKPLMDDRFKGIFENEDFEIDETSREFAMHNASSVPTIKQRTLTAVDEEESDGSRTGSASEDGDNVHESSRKRQREGKVNEFKDSNGRVGSASYGKAGKQRQQGKTRQQGPALRVSSSAQKSRRNAQQDQPFGDLASSLPSDERRTGATTARDRPFGEKQITFAPSNPRLNPAQPKERPQNSERADGGGRVYRGQDRRSASGNTFRRM